MRFLSLLLVSCPLIAILNVAGIDWLTNRVRSPVLVEQGVVPPPQVVELVPVPVEEAAPATAGSEPEANSNPEPVDMKPLTDDAEPAVSYETGSPFLTLDLDSSPLQVDLNGNEPIPLEGL